MMPGLVNLLAPLRLLPVSVFDWLGTSPPVSPERCVARANHLTVRRLLVQAMF